MHASNPEAILETSLLAALRHPGHNKRVIKQFTLKAQQLESVRQAMEFHGSIWRALDRLAGTHGLTASGLARQAGLDPTTFNKSKRVTREGKLRWPSTESVARALAATGSSLFDLVALVEEAPGGERSRKLPLFALGDTAGLPDANGGPAQSERSMSFPGIADARAFALEVGDETLVPVYHPGDVLIVSPTSPSRHGDRVLVKTRQGQVHAQQLLRRAPRRIELIPLHPRLPEIVVATDDIEWIARILWASQGKPGAATL